MSKDILFNKATITGPVAEIGKIAILTVGAKKHRFVIHGEADPVLSDWRTGYKVASLNDAKVRAMVARGHHFKLDDRQAAQETLDRILRTVGPEKVFATLKQHPTINTKQEAAVAPQVAA